MRLNDKILGMSIERLEQDLKAHMAADHTFQTEAGGNIKEIKDDIKVIKENHLAHVQVDLAKTTTNVDWLMRNHWIVATAAVGAFIAGIVNFFK